MSPSGRPKLVQILSLLLIIAGAAVAVAVQYVRHVNRMAKTGSNQEAAVSPTGATPIAMRSIPEIIADVNAHQDPREFKFLNHARVAMMRQALADTSRPMD